MAALFAHACVWATPNVLRSRICVWAALTLSSLAQVERLLGKGGFGVVNLAIYRGKEVAMKQLLTIESDSVKRFR